MSFEFGFHHSDAVRVLTKLVTGAHGQVQHMLVFYELE